MFFTNPRFENPFLSGISSTGDRYYRAIELSGRLTWFIVNCALRDDDLELLHSVCCSLDEDLLGLLQPMPHVRVVSVQRVSSSEDEDGGWEVQQVRKIWRASTEAGKGILVVQAADGKQYCGPFGETVDVELAERTLIFESSTKVMLESPSSVPSAKAN